MGKAEKYKILFVCLGNICRSPAAYGIMERIIAERKLEESVYVDSAGISGYHSGDLPDGRMRIHARQRGLDLTHRSRKVRISDFDEFDEIIGMDDANVDELRELAPSVEDAEKVVKISKYFRHHPNWDCIPDPYYGGSQGFEDVLDLLDDACNAIADDIVANKLTK